MNFLRIVYLQILLSLLSKVLSMSHFKLGVLKVYVSLTTFPLTECYKIHNQIDINYFVYFITMVLLSLKYKKDIIIILLIAV